MKSSGYINIQGWMINELKLKGNNLLLFAVIYGFSQDGTAKFTGSLKYLQGCLGASKNTVMNSLEYLVKMRFLIKETTKISGVTFCIYFHNERVVQKLVDGGANSDMGGGANFGINNSILDNTVYNDNINKERIIDFFKTMDKKGQASLLEAMGVKKNATLILFSESKWNNYEVLRDYLKEDAVFREKYTGVDLKYYIQKVDTWSENSQTKRTDRGWLQTIRDWITEAKLKNEIVMLPSSPSTGHKNH